MDTWVLSTQSLGINVVPRLPYAGQPGSWRPLVVYSQGDLPAYTDTQGVSHGPATNEPGVAGVAVELVANAQQNGPWFINYPNGGPSGVQCATIATAAEQAATTPWALLQAITATSIQVPNVPHLVPGSSPPQYTGLPPGSTAQQLYAGAAVPGFTPPFLTWEFYSTTVGPTVTVTLPSTINGKANPLASFSITAPPGGPVVFTATTATTPYTASGTVISVDTLSALAVLIGTDMGTVLSYIGATSGVLWRPPSH